MFQTHFSISSLAARACPKLAPFHDRCLFSVISLLGYVRSAIYTVLSSLASVANSPVFISFAPYKSACISDPDKYASV
jgi:hypothetical protein